MKQPDHTPKNMITDLKLIAHDVSDSAEIRQQYSGNFGRIFRQTPAVVVAPESTAEVAAILRYANQHSIPVGTQGAAHSQTKQNLTDDGILLRTHRLNELGPVLPDQTMWVGGGVPWRAVIERLRGTGLLPPVLTNNTDVTVGGTISIIGIGTTSFRYGGQADNVEELEVVTASGDVVICSRTQHKELFDSVRAGLGQVGLITRARLRLRKHKTHIHLVQMLYDNIDVLMDDCFMAMEYPEVETVESFCSPAPMGFRDGPWGKEFFASWFFPMQLGFAYNEGEAPPTEALLSKLRPYRKIQTHTYSFPDYFLRMDLMFDLWHKMGYWDMAHPWVEAILPRSTAANVQLWVDRVSPVALAGGHVLVWPALRAASEVPLFRVPAEDRLIGFGILGGAPQPMLEVALPRLNLLHEMILDSGGYRYLSGYVEMDAGKWKAHYGDQWPAFVAAKKRFDPSGILNPGTVPFEE